MPALADIGAVGAFADGIELEGAGELLEGMVVLADRRTSLEPCGLGRGCCAGGGDLDQFSHIFIVAGSGMKTS